MALGRQQTEQPWHALSGTQVLQELGSRSEGLHSAEVEQRRERYGPNELRREQAASPLALFLHQFKSFLIVLLLGATVLSLLLGEVLDAIVVVLIVMLSAVLGFVQEYRASRALEALRQLAAPTAEVIRAGAPVVVPTREIVPGDVIVLSTGDRLPADGRLLEAVNLRVDESPLTGESTPVAKDLQPLPVDTPLPDRANMVYGGTTVIAGRGKAVIVATGMATQFGQIAHLVQIGDDKGTPLERRMGEIGRRLGVAAIAVVAIVATLGVLRGGGLLEMFFWGVSLAVAAVPEALPAVVTAALTIGVQRMARRRAIVRRLPAVETLGSTSIICSDKTGTLTRNEMTVRRLWLGGRLIEVTGPGYEPAGRFLLAGQTFQPSGDLLTLARAALLCNDADLATTHGRHRIVGDPTEGALVVMAAKAGLDYRLVRTEYPRTAEVPFDSTRKRMSTVHRTPAGRGLVCTKGAPETVLPLCSRYLRDGRGVPLDPATRRQALAAARDMAADALRVLAVCLREVPAPHLGPCDERCAERLEQDLMLAGLVGEVDPPRQEARLAVQTAESAGVRSVMITGDHPETAVAVARELGIMKDGSLALTGADLDRLPQARLAELAPRVAVYARVSPQHKIRIVDALQQQGQTIAMTGDGINDAPALRAADVGVAMGIAGTDVTKEAADMVITDDNYASIVQAVAEGRVIYDNIRKFLRYLLATNTGEITTMFVAVLLGLPLPLLAIQILWVNLVTDGLPALGLGVEPAERNVMQRPPRPPRETVFAGGLWQHILWVGALMAAGSLAVFHWGLQSFDLDTARTLTFLTLATAQLAHVLAIRSERESLFTQGLFSNTYLALAVAAAFALQLAVIYLPFLQGPFRTISLSPLQLALSITVASSVFWAVEFEKLLRRRGESRQQRRI